MHDINKKTYYPAIDGLRAIAVLSVFLFHIDERWMPGGFLGVDIFFVISGFVVTHSLYQRRHLDFFRFAMAFYASRLRRIFPALIFCVLVIYLLAAVLIPPVELRAVREAAIYSLAAVSNFYFISESTDYFGIGLAANPYSHMWSLSIEEQFYVIYSVTSFYLVSASHKLTAVKNYVLLSVITLSASYFIYLNISGDSSFYYNSLGRFWEIMLGAQLYFFLKRRKTALEKSDNLPNALFISGMIGVLASIVLADGGQAFYFFLVTLSTCLIISGCVLESRTKPNVSTALAIKPLVIIGLLSYSIYLWHWPILTLFRWTVSLESAWALISAVLLVFLLSAISYVLVEKPTKRLFLARPRMAAAGVLTVFAGGLVSVAHSDALLFKGDPYTPIAFRNVQSPHDWESSWRECHHKHHADSTDEAIKRCLTRRNDDDARQAIFVVGDSHANAIFFAVRNAFETHDKIDLGQMHNNGARVIVNDGEIPIEVRHVIDTVQQGDILMIAFFRAVMFESVKESFYVDLRDNPVSYPGVQSKIDRGATVLNEIARLLDEKGANLLLVRDVPQLAKPLRVEACMVQEHLGLPNACDVDSKISLHRRKPMDHLIDLVAAQNGNVFVWDPHPLVCPENICTFARDGIYTMVDNNHLSQIEAERIGPDFAKFITANGLLHVTNETAD